jgi:ABC-type phosphate transport system substrate-binding protein
MRISRTIAGLSLLSVALALPGLNAVQAPQFVIVVNKQNQLAELSPGKLKTIYLRRISRWPWGAEILPVDLADGSGLRQEFNRSILRTTSEELAVYWIDQKTTRGVNPPLLARNPEAVKSAVASQVGAIGYIPITAVDARVKVLELAK